MTRLTGVGRISQTYEGQMLAVWGIFYSLYLFVSKIVIIQKLKFGQNLKTQIVTQLKNLNDDKTQNSNSDKTQKLKL